MEEFLILKFNNYGENLHTLSRTRRPSLSHSLSGHLSLRLLTKALSASFLALSNVSHSFRIHPLNTLIDWSELGTKDAKIDRVQKNWRTSDQFFSWRQRYVHLNWKYLRKLHHFCERKIRWQHFYRIKNVSFYLIKIYFLVVKNSAGYHLRRVMPSTSVGAQQRCEFLFKGCSQNNLRKGKLFLVKNEFTFWVRLFTYLTSSYLTHMM